jgi:hypothetical protein
MAFVGHPNIQLPAIVIHKYVYWIWVQEKAGRKMAVMTRKKPASQVSITEGSGNVFADLGLPSHTCLC